MSEEDPEYARGLFPGTLQFGTEITGSNPNDTVWCLEYRALFLDPAPSSAVTGDESPRGNRKQPQMLGDLSDLEGQS